MKKFKIALLYMIYTGLLLAGVMMKKDRPFLQMKLVIWHSQQIRVPLP